LAKKYFKIDKRRFYATNHEVGVVIRQI